MLHLIGDGTGVLRFHSMCTHAHAADRRPVQCPRRRQLAPQTTPRCAVAKCINYDSFQLLNYSNNPIFSPRGCRVVPPDAVHSLRARN